MDTQTFIIDIGDDCPEDGVYCSYCGEKLSPKQDEETHAFFFQCGCVGAIEEKLLREIVEVSKEELTSYLEKFSFHTVDVELRTRIAAHQNFVDTLTKELQDHVKAISLKENSIELDDQNDNLLVLQSKIKLLENSPLRK